MNDIPSSTSLQQGIVIETQRRHFMVRLASGETLRCVAQGRDWQLACGDRVRVNVREAAITELLARDRLFYRADQFKQKLLAANVSQVVIVCAPDPLPNAALINRSLVVAEATGVQVLIVANKSDLNNQAPLHHVLRPLSALGYEVMAVSRHDAASVDRLQQQLSTQRSVFVGQSGVGKSSLLNALLGDEAQRVGALSERSEAAGTGKHTTTFSALFMLSEEAWLIDSPGVQVFGLAHLTASERVAAFPEFRALAGHCRFRDCSHTHEKDCAFKGAVASGQADPTRLQFLIDFLKD